MRYLVTGGAGFIGSNTVDELERRVRSLHPEVMRVISHTEPQALIT